MAPTDTSSHPSGPILLKTATSTLHNNNKRVNVNILLDEGAQRTFVTRSTIQNLGVSELNCRSEDINISSFGATQPQSKCVDVVKSVGQSTGVASLS